MTGRIWQEAHISRKSVRSCISLSHAVAPQRQKVPAGNPRCFGIGCDHFHIRPATTVSSVVPWMSRLACCKPDNYFYGPGGT